MGAIAGKVMIRPRGDYDSSAVYDILDLVKYDNKPWLCRKNDTMGIIPVDGEYWMNIIDISIANADTLDGHDSNYFATVAALEALTADDVEARSNTWLPTPNEIGAAEREHTHTAEGVGAIPIIDARSAEYDMDVILNTPDTNAFYITSIPTLGTPYAKGITAFTDATIFSCTNTGLYGYQIAFMDGILPLMRVLKNGVISDWNTGFLTLAGGTLSGELIFKKYDNGISKIYKNHSANADYGLQLLDETSDGASARLVICANPQRTPLAFEKDGTTYVVFGGHNTVPVANGGTGATTFTSGAALIGNGTGAVTTRAITNNSAASSAIGANTNLITGNTLQAAVGRTNGFSAANTNYTTFMGRAIALNTAVPSSLTNGCITLVYA